MIFLFTFANKWKESISWRGYQLRVLLSSSRVSCPHHFVLLVKPNLVPSLTILDQLILFKNKVIPRWEAQHVCHLWDLPNKHKFPNTKTKKFLKKILAWVCSNFTWFFAGISTHFWVVSMLLYLLNNDTLCALTQTPKESIKYADKPWLSHSKIYFIEKWFGP